MCVGALKGKAADAKAETPAGLASRSPAGSATLLARHARQWLPTSALQRESAGNVRVDMGQVQDVRQQRVLTPAAPDRLRGLLFIASQCMDVSRSAAWLTRDAGQRPPASALQL